MENKDLESIVMKIKMFIYSYYLWNAKEKGAISFDGGLDQARRIVENEVFK